MDKIYFNLNNNIKLLLQLFHILSCIYIHFDIIYILSSKKHSIFINQIFFNMNNVKIINDTKQIDKINYFYYTNIDEFLKKYNLDNIKYKLCQIYRNYELEHLLYDELKNKIGDNYIFYFNNNQNKIINYFEDIYVYNPILNFYEKDHPKYDLWIDLNINNYSLYLTIIENSKEIHIYDLDLLYLILEINLNNIKIKNFYYHDIFIKQKDNRLHDWNIIVIK